jgi:orotidine-5'-phosphate decarboxylase
MTLANSERIIVALDVDSTMAADSVIGELAGRVGAFKVGLQLFSAAGPQYVRRLTERGIRVFLDLKFHDIPNTVAKAAVEASKLGVWMLNVHASGGREMMERTVQEVGSECERTGMKRPLMIAVTVLTSSNEEALRETGVSNEVEKQVGNLARLAAVSNMDGVVASPREVEVIRREVLNPEFLTVTPGIRPKAGTLDDQKRVTTFGQALANGSDYVVIGRPITQASDRVAAVEQILSEVEN